MKADNKDDPKFQKLVEAYHSAEVEAAVAKLNDDNLEFKADWTAAKLQDELTSLEDLLKKSRG